MTNQLFYTNDCKILNMKKTTPPRKEGDDFDRALGAWIKQSRGKMKLTQEKFGDLMGCTKATVCGWEKGHYIPPYKVLYKIADKSGIPLPHDKINEVCEKYGEELLDVLLAENLRAAMMALAHVSVEDIATAEKILSSLRKEPEPEVVDEPPEYNFVDRRASKRRTCNGRDE